MLPVYLLRASLSPHPNVKSVGNSVVLHKKLLFSIVEFCKECYTLCNNTRNEVLTMRLHHDFIWSSLLHFMTNWSYEEGNYRGGNPDKVWLSPASSKLRFDYGLYRQHLQDLKAAGVNAVIVDVGDALIYKSHPEIAVEGAFTYDEMKAELDYMNEMGFEVIPKLNFSTAHDIWMKDYSRMVSTPLYYQVVEDLIDEVCELFEPRFIHLGLDEETYEHQARYDYAVVRQNDLWWKDLYFYVRCAEKNGVRPMMWSDYARNHPEEFVQKCPKSMVQCVWYYFNQYGDDIEEKYRIRIMPIDVLEKAGFDQLPTGSIEYDFDCMPKLVDYCTDHISKEHLLGFMQTTWAPIMDQWKYMLDKGNAATMDGIKVYEEKNKR